MKNENYLSVSEKALTQTINGGGAFLTVKDKDKLNTMTIGWASVGYLWSKPMLTVMVRNSRFTFGLMEEAVDFTVSVPATDMKQALSICGTKSGADVDKFKLAGLTVAQPQKTLSPVINCTGIHYECLIINKMATDPKFLSESYHALYPKKDYHTLYFGEIVECYSI